MCGICGKMNHDPSLFVDERGIRRMLSTLVHRGPDDEGTYVEGPVGLGHRRLSIIDLTESGHQPMSNEDGTLWIVFNGEIYNFIELRDGLVSKGHRFMSRTDTEVILRLYEEEGVECIRKLRGMFAFALWDRRNRLLFLARDRVGKKPLFYRNDGKSFLFASEIKAMMAEEGEKEPDPIAIHHYLTYQYVPSPFSAFKGVRKLPPAHYMICKGGKLFLKRYWQLDYLPKFPVRTRRDRENLRQELLAKIEESVRIRLASDVPLGAFLSGGIDSSLIVAFMSKLLPHRVKTFSIGFPEKEYDELPFARKVARLFKTDHLEFEVRPNAVDVLPKLAWHYNEPYADSSAIPTYCVSRLAREHVTVALNGDGGDESFAGYERYLAAVWGERMGLCPSFLLSPLLPMVEAFPHRSSSFLGKLDRFLREHKKPPELKYMAWMSHFTPEMKRSLYTDGFWSQTHGSDPADLLIEKYSESRAKSFLDKTLYCDVMMYLPDDLLVKVDIASMANSLEARSPLLDHELMEFAARIPAAYKLKGNVTKYVLKRSLRGILPKDILSRPKKGFGVPLAHWFRNELKEMAYDVLLGKKCVERGYFKKEAVQKMLDEHAQGRSNWQYPLYNLLMLELWHRCFIP